MAGERCVDCKRSSFIITDLTDHYYFWALTHQRTHSARKRKTDFIFYLCLIDAIHLILDRIFDRRNIYIGRIQNIQNSVKRRGFSRASRASVEDHTGRELGSFVNTLKSLAMETYSFE